MRVLIVGATGALGAKITQSFVRALDLAGPGAFEITAMSRRVQAANGPVRWVQGDMLKPDTLAEALKGVDVVVSSANGYMKESLAADLEGNANLIRAAKDAKVSRFVFLSVIASEKAPYVPHFEAKAKAEALLKQSGLPYVFIRAGAFLDQEPDYIADNASKYGIFLSMGAKDRKWSYVYSPDLADDVVKAALYKSSDINFKSIDIGWSDGPKSQAEIAELVKRLGKQPKTKKLSVYTLPNWLLFGAGSVAGRFSEFAYDIIQMFRFFFNDDFVADQSTREPLLGKAPTAEDAVRRFVEAKGL